MLYPVIKCAVRVASAPNTVLEYVHLLGISYCTRVQWYLYVLNCEQKLLLGRQGAQRQATWRWKYERTGNTPTALLLGTDSLTNDLPKTAVWRHTGTRTAVAAAPVIDQSKAMF